MLKEDVQRYITLRRSTGFKLKQSARLLADYADFAEATGDQYIRTCTAIAWAEQASTPDTRYRRITDVIRLARFLHAENVRHEIPLVRRLCLASYKVRTVHLHRRRTRTVYRRRPRGAEGRGPSCQA